MNNVLTASAAALALAGVTLGAAAPAEARYHGGYYGHGGYHHYHGGGIGLGGALLGAAIIGGIAVAASNADRGPPVVYGDAPPPPRDGYAVYDRGAPVDESAESGPVGDCSRAVEQTAEQRGGEAHVAGIDRVEPIDGGANVLGYLEIDRGRDAPLERVGFSCRAAYGEVTGVRIG